MKNKQQNKLKFNEATHSSPTSLLYKRIRATICENFLWGEPNYVIAVLNQLIKLYAIAVLVHWIIIKLYFT